MNGRGSGRHGRSLLFLDVDGPLLPFGEGARAASSPLTPELGRRLAALPCELVWATTWEEAANTDIAPRLGLPRLPVVRWREPTDQEEREDRWFGLCWKTRTLVRWAAGRSFAWVDDEITDADREWVAAHHEGPALLHRVEPAVGLVEEDLAVLARWVLAW
ncbi:MAG: hypothetical protein HOV86_00300 [Thermoactinospora sp.]|nr:hypothetical protein [Thermoactinospora sp.]